MWFIGVEVEQETSAPSPKKNPGSAPASARLAAIKASLLPALRFSHRRGERET